MSGYKLEEVTAEVVDENEQSSQETTLKPQSYWNKFWYGERINFFTEPNVTFSLCKYNYIYNGNKCYLCNDGMKTFYLTRVYKESSRVKSFHICNYCSKMIVKKRKENNLFNRDTDILKK